MHGLEGPLHSQIIHIQRMYSYLHVLNCVTWWWTCLCLTCGGGGGGGGGGSGVLRGLGRYGGDDGGDAH